MNEREMAIAIAHGDLQSPSQCQNSWLYAMRITGTGASYRIGLKEFVWRDPSIFLRPEFVNRCNGLPVIMVHPDASLLNAEEYVNRTIGSVIYPYVARDGREVDDGDEVWGIARIFDGDIVDDLRSGKASTSPGVQFTKGDVLARAEVDGEKLLIEGSPSLLDHLAIVAEGVWDKGAGLSGIRNDSMSDEKSEGEKKYGDVKFADPENDKYPIDTEEHIRAAWNYIHQQRDADKYSPEKAKEIREKIVSAWKRVISEDGPPEAHEDHKMAEDEKKADGENKIMECMDKLSKRMDDMMTAYDGLNKRFDAMETKRKDAKRKDAKEETEEETEEERKDAKEETEEETEEERKDAKRKDAKRKDAGHIQSEEPDLNLRGKIAEMQRKLDAFSSEPDFEDAAKLADAQHRADLALQSLGERIERPLLGERSQGYRRRVLARLQKYSSSLKEIPLHGLDGAAFDAIENTIYADAQVASRSDAVRTIGRLIPIVTRDGAGREITRYQGDPRAWRRQFSAPPVGVQLARPRSQ